MSKEYGKIMPESVNIGDVIEVVMPVKLGITTRVRGTVAHRESYSSGTRRLFTAEGGELYSWFPGKARGAIFRVGHETRHKPETLFEMSDNV